MKEKETKKTIRTFAIASFLNDLGSDIIYPIWPMFVTTILHANMAVLGLIDGLGEAIISISQAISGYYSDRIKKRKIFIWIGYLMGSLSRIGYAISSVWQHLIPFRILDRAGKIRSAPRDAIIADISTNENRGRNFGFLRAMDNLGAVVGIVICILFFDLLGFEKLFMLASIPSLIGAALILVFIKERKEPEKKIFKGITFKHFDRNSILFFSLNSIFALGSFSYSFLLIFANKFGFEIIFVPVLYLIYTGVASIVSLPFGKLADKIGRKNVMFISFICWALVCLNILLMQAHIAIIITFILYGVHKGALEPVQKTLVAEFAPDEYRASFLGSFQMLIGLCALPSSLIAGLLWDKIGIFIPFYFSLGLTVVAIILLFFVKEKHYERR